MSSIATMTKSFSEAPWQLWWSQLGAILRIELKKAVWMRRSIWIYPLAFLVPFVMWIQYVRMPLGGSSDLDGSTRVLSLVFQIFYLRIAIFFGCLGLFTWLFRGDVLEKSLHYYFLAPMRRELLVAGKFLAGLISSALIFGSAILLCFTFLYAHSAAAGRAYVFSGPGLGQLLAYLSVTLLACLGYGAVFLALSLVFKNPILPGAFVLLWEVFHVVLPSLLQKLSITFYLKQLCPVTLRPEGLMALFAIVAEPVPAWIAVTGLVCLCAAILVFACVRVRRMEISYLAD
jgi:ABC-type transport system involved in multi-copper enzyme maturation permease subunit